MKHPFFIKVLTVIITVILLALLFTQIDIKDIITILININPIFLVAGFILYLCSYLFRAWRFHILLNKEVGFSDLFHIVCMHNLVNNVLPARTGELSYVYLLKTKNRTTGEGIATLVVARIFDFIIISVLFLFSLLINKNSPSGLMKFLWMGVFLVLIMIFLFALLIFSGNWANNQIITFFRYFHVETSIIGQFIIRKSEETISCISRISRDKTTAARILGSGFILSIFIWISLYSMIYLLMFAMGFEFSYTIVLLGSTFAIFSTILPIQGIGGFGTTESAWVIGFVFLGLSNSDAIQSAFGYHIIVLVFTIFLGLIGFLFLKRKSSYFFLQ